MSVHSRASRRKFTDGPISPMLLSPPIPVGAPAGGQLLDKTTQSTMSVRFGHDFSQVRIHTDSRAGAAARALGADAFAAGNDISFADDRYTPGSLKTDQLLAHELTHVVQQAHSGPIPTGHAVVSRPTDPCEQEAEALASQVVAGRNVRVQAPPSAPVSRSVSDDISSFFRGTAGLAGGAAGLVGEGVAALAGPGQAPRGPGNAAGAFASEESSLNVSLSASAFAGLGGPVIDAIPDGAIGRAFGTVYDAGRDYINEQEEEARPMVELVGEGEKKADEGITSAEKKERALTKSVTDEVPWLAPMAEDVDDATNFVGGVGRSVTGTTGGVVKTMADPWGTVEGAGRLAMHLNDPEYLEKTFVAPYKAQWDQGNYFDVAGHVFGDAVTMLAGGEEADAANAARTASEGETVARETEVFREEAGVGARDPWATAGDPPSHEPPSGPPRGGGGGGRAGGGPQGISEMIQDELDKAERAQPGFGAHPGATPLDPADLHDPGHRLPPAPPETWLMPPTEGGMSLDPLPPAVPSDYQTMVDSMTHAGMTPEDAAQTARELAAAPEVESGGVCRLSPEKQMQLDKSLGANRGRRR